MKSSFKYRFELYKQSLNTQKFVLVFALSIIFTIYGIFVPAFSNDYINGFIKTFSWPIYIAGMLLILLLNTSNIFNLFESNQFYIIRFKDKKEYLSELIKTILFCNACTLLLNVIFIMIGLNIFNRYISLEVVNGYRMSPLIYAVYVVVKFYILSSIISVVTTLLLKIMDSRLVIVLNILLYILIAATPYNAECISSILNMPLSIGSYFLGGVYSSFLFEVICFLLYSSILVSIIEIMRRFIVKRMRDVA